MRTLLRLTDEPRAVKRGGSSDAVGIACRRRQRVWAAHTIAMTAHRARRDGVLTIDKREHGSDIAHHGRDGHLGAYRTHTCVLCAALLEHVWPKNRVPPGAVVQVGQQHVVANSGETPHHVPELLADTIGIHQKEHGGIWPAPFGTADKGFHQAVCRRDVHSRFDHRMGSSALGPSPRWPRHAPQV